jgi:hypothetical protein
MAEVNIPLLSKELFKQFARTNIWVLQKDVGTTVDCTYAYSSIILHVGLNNKNLFHCLCQRAVIETSTPSYTLPMAATPINTTKETNNTRELMFIIK